jgi:putative colanic acid biosynthesis acetyltransferase WcaF
MGAHSVVGTGAEIYNLAKITIGSNAVISQDAYLCSASHDYTDKAFPLFSKPISIGEGAWVASKAFVGPGVSIGEGTVIGACSVVTKDMPAWMVCAGNPCKPIKPRLMQNTNA